MDNPIRAVSIAVCGELEHQRTALSYPDTNVNLKFDPERQEVVLKELLEDPERPGDSLSITVVLNKQCSELRKLEEHERTNLLIGIGILEGRKRWLTCIQKGFSSGLLKGPLKRAFCVPWHTTMIELIVPIADVPWEWIYTFSQYSFGRISRQSTWKMEISYHRERGGNEQLDESDASLGEMEGKTMESLLVEERRIERMLDIVDGAEKVGLMDRYEELTCDIEAMKRLLMWKVEAERLNKEHQRLLDYVGEYHH